MRKDGLSTGIIYPLSEEQSAAIQRRLRTGGSLSLRQIECEFCDGLVVLRGRVSTYYVKQLAQSLLLADPAVERVENLIEVVAADASGGREPL